MKKIVSVLASLIFVILGAVSLNGCAPSEDEKVMNVSLNPQVEFILGHNNEVVSVNALNEEGNVIISASASYIGKSATHAAELFIQASKETGYLVSGRAGEGENQVSFSISGDSKQAEKLYNEVKVCVQNKFTQLNLSGNVANFTALTSEYLKEQVEDCCPYFSSDEVDEMSYEDLIFNLKESRNETKEFLSQQLKKAYYEAKNDAYNYAKFDYVKNHWDSGVKYLFENAQNGYQTAINHLEDVRKEYLLDETSGYQKALAKFNEKKIAYLKYRNEVSQMAESDVTPAIQLALNTLNNAVETAETSLQTAFSTANGLIDVAKTAVTTAFGLVVGTLNTANQIIYDALNITNDSIKTAITTFETNFATTYNTYKTKAKQIADNMRDSLKNAE